MGNDKRLDGILPHLQDDNTATAPPQTFGAVYIRKFAGGRDTEKGVLSTDQASWYCTPFFFFFFFFGWPSTVFRTFVLVSPSVCLESVLCTTLPSPMRQCGVLPNYALFGCLCTFASRAVRYLTYSGIFHTALGVSPVTQAQQGTPEHAKQPRDTKCSGLGTD